MFDDNNLYGDAVGLDMRGRHNSLSSALEAAFKDLITEKNEFFDYLRGAWKELFPNVPAWPGRYEDGKIFLYVRTAPTLYMLHPKLGMMANKLRALPNAPKKVTLRLEIHAQ